METNRHLLQRAVTQFLVLAIFIYFGYGCTTTILTPHYAGSKIKPGYPISINQGEHLGNYRSDDLAIDYKYTRNGDDLKIWGKIKFANATQLNFNYIDYFNLSLLIADSEAQVLTNHGLVSTSWVNLTGSADEVHFTQNVKLPADASFMAFTYTGQASEGGSGDAEDGGGNTQFWEYPIVK